MLIRGDVLIDLRQKMMEEAFIPYLIAINLTKQCNLNCDHCYMDAEARVAPSPSHLTLEKLNSLFSEIATRAPQTIIVLTGGEPLYRTDLPEIVRAGNDLGLKMVLGTNGLLLTDKKIEALQGAGLQGMGISLDSIHEEAHDRFRGVPDAFRKTCENIKKCIDKKMHVQIHFTVTKDNSDEIEDAVKMAKNLGATIINFFFLVCIGRGNSKIDLTPTQYEDALLRIARLQKNEKGIMVQSRCTPHFKRILYQENPESEYTRAMGYDGGGCPAATHYCRIDPKGEVTPCPYMEISGGSVHQSSFWDIWDKSTLFDSFRRPELLKGRCGSCEFKSICGGCRARSLVENGDLMGEDPNCSYVPEGKPLIRVQDLTPNLKIHWDEEAQNHLKKVPFFLRKRLSKRLEEKANREGQVTITLEFMKGYRKEREKELGIKFQ